MASNGGENAQKALQLYIHGYMVERGMHGAAEIFAKEANIGDDRIVTDERRGFLTEWWTIFSDMYFPKYATHPRATERTSYQIEQQVTMPKPDLLNQQRAMQSPRSEGFNEMLRQPAPSLLASNVHEQGHSRLPARCIDPNLRPVNFDGLAIPKQIPGHPRPSLPQVSQKAQQQLAKDKNISLVVGRAIPMNFTPSGVSKPVLPISELRNAGSGEGTSSNPLYGRNLTGVNKVPTRMPCPILSSALPVQNQQQQLQTSAAQRRELLSQVLANTPGKQILPFQGINNNLSNLVSPRTQMMAPRRQTNEQQMVVPIRQTIQQNLQQQQQMRLQMQQQLLQNNRKRKNLLGQLAEEIILDDMDADMEKPSDENMESFISHDDDNADIMSTCISNFERRSLDFRKNWKNEFSLEEVGSLHSSTDKLICCHFSSDGKFLAGAGHDKKVLLWNMNNFNFVGTPEIHSDGITDVRFRPGSSVFATSSLDKTVQVWDAKDPSKSLFMLIGHDEQVTSLDFHPKKVDLLCSCDGHSEIRLWNINKRACTCIIKGSTSQVRFQQGDGNLLAAASGNEINLFDVETNSFQFSLKGHEKQVHTICWDASGKYIASVSEDEARVWSVVSGGKSIHELHSNGKKFDSCTFHPGYSQLLVIGSDQSFELWNSTESNMTSTVTAHSSIISALASSPQTGIIASASHDQCLKVWK